jgi:uncharacterized LabA/DUF88 family protein
LGPSKLRVGGFFYFMKDQTFFLVDGFNLYHSIRDITYYCDSQLRLKWLDISALCKFLLHRIGNADLAGIYYFSAFAYHLNDPEIIARHKTYIKCLEDTGIEKQISRFKPREIQCTLFQASNKTCPNCSGVFQKHEEKETDVAIASKLFELLFKGNSDCIVLVTGDTDLAPAVTTARLLYPNKRILFAFPYRRANAQLKQISPNSFKLKVKDYRLHQFPDPYPMSDGTLVAKPPTW